MKQAIVISASSDIGKALCLDWSKKGGQVAGTYRTYSESLKELEALCPLCHLDLLDPTSQEEAFSFLISKVPRWDVLLFAPGSLEPIGKFNEVDFDQWERGIRINLLEPLRLLRKFLDFRKKEANPTVLFFAGAGTNGPAPRYSSYAISKIALIKMCELLDDEMPDTRFVILGPGWVKTKIHEETLRAEGRAGENFARTVERFQKEAFNSMERVIECIDWLIETPGKSISGRNYSLVSDPWRSKSLEMLLTRDSDLYKLRRVTAPHQ